MAARYVNLGRREELPIGKLAKQHCSICTRILQVVAQENIQVDNCFSVMKAKSLLRGMWQAEEGDFCPSRLRLSEAKARTKSKIFAWISHCRTFEFKRVPFQHEKPTFTPQIRWFVPCNSWRQFMTAVVLEWKQGSVTQFNLKLACATEPGTRHCLRMVGGTISRL